jgi:hypothetical protein
MLLNTLRVAVQQSNSQCMYSINLRAFLTHAIHYRCTDNNRVKIRIYGKAHCRMEKIGI